MAGQRKASLRQRDIGDAIKETLPVGLGLVPLGLAFGLLVSQAGFNWWWAPIFSIIVYAGSMEYLAVGLVLAHTSIIGAALTAFMVNFRHIFYGLTFPRNRIKNSLGRAYSTYALTDESYAIVSAARTEGRSGAWCSRFKSCANCCGWCRVLSVRLLVRRFQKVSAVQNLP